MSRRESKRKRCKKPNRTCLLRLRHNVFFSVSDTTFCSKMEDSFLTDDAYSSRSIRLTAFLSTRSARPGNGGDEYLRFLVFNVRLEGSS